MKARYLRPNNLCLHSLAVVYWSSIINTGTQSTVETSKLALGSNNANDGTRARANKPRQRDIADETLCTLYHPVNSGSTAYWISIFIRILKHFHYFGQWRIAPVVAGMRCSRGLCIFERCTLHINAISPHPKDDVLEGEKKEKRGTEIVEPWLKEREEKQGWKDRRHVHRDIFRAASSTVYQLHQLPFPLSLLLSILFIILHYLGDGARIRIYTRIYIQGACFWYSCISLSLSLSLSRVSRRNVSKDYKAREIFSGHRRHNSATTARFIPRCVSMRDLHGVCPFLADRLSSKSRTTGFRSHNGPVREIWMHICRALCLCTAAGRVY